MSEPHLVVRNGRVYAESPYQPYKHHRPYGTLVLDVTGLVDETPSKGVIVFGDTSHWQPDLVVDVPDNGYLTEGGDDAPSQDVTDPA